MNDPVSTETKERACVISLNCEITGNIVCQEMLDGIYSALDKAESDKDVNIVVIKSAVEGVFSKGHDIARLEKMDHIEIKQYNLRGQRLVRMLRGMKKPVLAMVDGDCFGPAFEIILACDMVFATKRSRFGFNETAYGFIPGFGGTQLASRKIYETFVKYLVFTGEPVSAMELFNKGMISKVSDDREELTNYAIETARLLARRSSFAMGLAKETINNTVDMDFSKGLLLEQNAFTFSFSTFDKTEGTNAFLEKREPQFRDRWEDYRF